MRIVVPTSNGYAHLLRFTIPLLDRHWPNRPWIDVLHHEQVPEKFPRTSLLDFGRQSDMPFTELLKEYLCDAPEKIILLCLDDYAVFQPINQRAVDVGNTMLSCGDSNFSFALTWQPGDPKTPITDEAQAMPAWRYSVNLQAALWRTDLLLTILRMSPRNDPWQMEHDCSTVFNEHFYPKGCRMLTWNIPRPHNAGGWVDRTDKTHWPFAYHNIHHNGQPDPYHEDFLKQEGFVSREP